MFIFQAELEEYLDPQNVQVCIMYKFNAIIKIVFTFPSYHWYMHNWIGKTCAHDHY